MTDEAVLSPTSSLSRPHQPPQPSPPHSPSSADSSSFSSCSSCPSSSDGDAFGSPSSRIEGEEETREHGDQESDGDESIFAVLLALFKKPLITCSSENGDPISGMEIGWPSDVRHVSHVTFDRFNGFVGLPVEFKPQVPTKPPSASTNVFGVSPESMQLSYDSRGNSVPTTLLMLQRRLYAQGGLLAEGVFRINAENRQEEYVRDQLNRGVVPDDIDVNCLAGLIKAWFRELPNGVLDSLMPEQVMRCQSEEDCFELVLLLPSTEAALLDWAVNLMADVVQHENVNKMNARSIAMVFAPNMTKMADPLSALMYAVQVMNFLKTLIMVTMEEREESMAENGPAFQLDTVNRNEKQNPAQTCPEKSVIAEAMVAKESVLESSSDSNLDYDTADGLSSF